MYIPPVTRLHPLGSSRSALSPSEEFSAGRIPPGEWGRDKVIFAKKWLIDYGTQPYKLLSILVAPENVMLSEAKNLAFLTS